MAIEAFPRSGKAYRIVVESCPHGVSVFVYLTSTSSFPEVDMLQDDLEMAKRACFEDYGVGDADWRERADREGK